MNARLKLLAWQIDQLEREKEEITERDRPLARAGDLLVQARRRSRLRRLIRKRAGRPEDPGT